MLPFSPIRTGISPVSDNGRDQVLCNPHVGPRPGLLPASLDSKAFWSFLSPTLRGPRKAQPSPLSFALKSPRVVTFAEQLRCYLPEPTIFPSEIVPSGLAEKILPRLRCLQVVLSRLPKKVLVAEGYSTTYYVEKLVCGHEVTSFPQAHSITARRRNCLECAKLQVSDQSSASVGGSEGGPRSKTFPPNQIAAVSASPNSSTALGGRNQGLTPKLPSQSVVQAKSAKAGEL